MNSPLSLSELMETSHVRFGTSGARGRVADMTDRVCMAYALGFLQMLRLRGEITEQTPVAVAGDRRQSTPRILLAVAAAASHLGHPVINAGLIPSPALALYGLRRVCPTIMVTGSHIPDDRNGIKFNTPRGEILKTDELAITAQQVTLPDAFDGYGMWREPPAALPAIEAQARLDYRDRWLRAFPANMLRGRHVVVYGHSAVGRELLVEVLRGLSADVTEVGWSSAFIPVDTEAIRPEDVKLGRGWGQKYAPFAIVSTDGDSDRPLVADETGTWLRGDVLGVLAARQLGAQVVVTPVSSNTVVERCSAFPVVVRTRIGSPYVIEAMVQRVTSGAARVLGYEANGGLLTATDFDVKGGGTLFALPTRDAIAVILSVLQAAVGSNAPVRRLAESLPSRATCSDRLQEFPSEQSAKILGELRGGGLVAAEQLLGDLTGPFVHEDLTDGIRLTTKADEVIHLRASGNAPELRCYAEAATDERAAWLVERVLARVRELA